MGSFIDSIRNRVYLCGDIGSTHGGSLSKAINTVKAAKKAGFDSVKFQLGVEPPNIDFRIEDYLEVVRVGDKIGIDISTSIFSYNNIDRREALIEKVIESKPKWIKFSYSQKHFLDDQTRFYKAGIAVVVSCDIMTRHIPIPQAIKLYCIPQYPVPYHVSFEDIFDKFYGLSDHTLGYSQTMGAITRELRNDDDKNILIHGAKWIEKHICLDTDDTSCPDACFSLSIDKSSLLINAVRSFERNRGFLNSSENIRKKSIMESIKSKLGF